MILKSIGSCNYNNCSSINSSGCGGGVEVVQCTCCSGISRYIYSSSSGSSSSSSSNSSSSGILSGSNS